MIVLSNSAEQTLAPGQSLTFDDVIWQSGCAECHRTNSASVKLRANGLYDVSFHANVGGPTAATPVQLTIELGGEPLLETTMISVPAAVGDFNNVSAGTRVKNCCGDYDRITVTNTGANSVIVAANSALVIGRVC